MKVVPPDLATRADGVLRWPDRLAIAAAHLVLALAPRRTSAPMRAALAVAAREHARTHRERGERAAVRPGPLLAMRAVAPDHTEEGM